jgi:class 3 adenylate cyclase
MSEDSYDLFMRLVGSPDNSKVKARSLSGLLPPPPAVTVPPARPESLPPPPGESKLKQSKTRTQFMIMQTKGKKITKGLCLPDPDKLGIGQGRYLQAAILYADLRGFTSMVASAPAQHSLVALEVFVSELTRIARDFGGEVVDCAGDRILVAFIVLPLNNSTKPIQRAVECGIWMQTAMYKAIQPLLATAGYPNISCGIGVDFSDVVITRVGIRNRNKLVFLGGAANHAAKLEELANPGETVMSRIAYLNRPQYMVPENGWNIVEDQLNGCYRCNSIFEGENPP